MPSGLSFVQSLLELASVLAALGAFALWVAEAVPPSRSGGGRRRLAAAWRDIAGAPWPRVSACLTGWLASRFDGLVRSGFDNADRHVAFSVVILSIMLVSVPAAAAVNALMGGSPFLFWYYLSLLGGVVLLIFAGETGRLKVVNGVLATYLGLSFWVVIPIYLVQSFTEVTINNALAHGVLKSIPVAVFWYIAAYGVGLAFDVAVRFADGDPAGSAAARFVHGFLASLPVGYVLTFAALLAGHFAVFDQDPARSWQLVLAGAGITALSLPLTTRIMAWGARRRGAALVAAYGIALAATSGLSVVLAYGAYAGGENAPTWTGAVNVLIGRSADGAVVHLGPAFWVSHLPFVPLLAFAFAVVAGFVAKAVVAGFRAAAGEGAVGAKPFLTSAVSSGGMAVLLWAAAAAL